MDGKKMLGIEEKNKRVSPIQDSVKRPGFSDKSKPLRAKT
jgi:hypothetical protein